MTRKVARAGMTRFLIQDDPFTWLDGRLCGGRQGAFSILTSTLPARLHGCPPDRVYRWLLRTYPAKVRRVYGASWRPCQAHRSRDGQALARRIAFIPWLQSWDECDDRL